MQRRTVPSCGTDPDVTELFTEEAFAKLGRVREIARIYKRRAKDEVFLPQDAEGFRQLWELAMEGEPRWSEDFPTSAFRVKRAWIADSFLLNKMLQACCEPKDYERELTRLTALLFDNTLLPEIRAICGFIYFEWIHPFQDGNGHTGRMLVPSALAGIYQLPTIVCFAFELVMRNNDGGYVDPGVETCDGSMADEDPATCDEI